jgi:hypothetical protein
VPREPAQQVHLYVELLRDVSALWKPEHPGAVHRERDAVTALAQPLDRDRIELRKLRRDDSSSDVRIDHSMT